MSTTVVLDASAAVDLLLRRRASGSVAEALERADITFAPELLDVEVLAALRNLALRRQITARRADVARQRLASLPVDRITHAALVDRAWRHRRNLTIYDAVYVAAAELVDGHLLTCDTRIAGAPGVDIPVTVLSG